jgi:nucleosome binding factor SPN SPT16 subunit
VSFTSYIKYDEIDSDKYLAKHLEQLKGGKIPLEVLVRGKDPEQNEKLFAKITDLIKSSGVSHPISHVASLCSC